MKTSDFTYFLPENLIAKRPLEHRSSSRLLTLDPVEQSIIDSSFENIIDFVQPNDILVLNNTKVIPARLFGHKETGGAIEILIERIVSENELLAHIRASKSPKPGSVVIVADARIEVVGRADDLFELRLPADLDMLTWLDANGHMPLPPYIDRADDQADSERYQTVFAEHPGAVAAPTAGLHFDNELLAKIKGKGVDTAFVTLHVGAGTFQPVRVEDVTNHVMHREWVNVTADAVAKIDQAKAKGGRVIAVGTTAVRSLETAAASGRLQPYQGDTQLFIYPGFQFHIVDSIITNFHLPESTLLMLVSAFAGKEFIIQAYEHAVAQEYRFFSYGDAMLLSRSIS